MSIPCLIISLQLGGDDPPLFASATLTDQEVALLKGKPGPDWKRDEHLDSIVNALMVKIRLHLEARKKDDS